MRNIKFRVLLAVLVVIFGGFCLFTYSASQCPSIQAVLAGDRKGVDFGFAIFGLFAFSLATLSLAKSYELLQSNNDKDEISDKNAEAAPKIQTKPQSRTFAVFQGEYERILELNRNLAEQLDETKQDRNSLVLQLKKFEEAFKEKISREEILKNNLIKLEKENKKIKEEMVQNKTLAKAKKKTSANTNRRSGKKSP